MLGNTKKVYKSPFNITIYMRYSERGTQSVAHRERGAEVSARQRGHAIGCELEKAHTCDMAMVHGDRAQSCMVRHHQSSGWGEREHSGHPAQPSTCTCQPTSMAHQRFFAFSWHRIFCTEGMRAAATGRVAATGRASAATAMIQECRRHTSLGTRLGCLD